MNKDTICALATANGIGAIGIIRVSGKDAINIVQKSFKDKELNSAPSHTIHYGYITDGDELIDEVMVSVFLAPKSFTTENCVEISFHGSPFIGKRILEILIRNGCRMAKAGEFTMRAFMNGRIDLSQAESIADLISSENEAARKIALHQLKGGITNEIALLRQDLLNFTSLVELELDFSEEDVEFADRSALKQLLKTIKSKLNNLINSFQYGNAVRNGIDTAIIGKPNAGKSTLLNALLKEERAIVSDIAGTTRDTIEEVLHIKGNAFRFIDTAGIRETTDKIEEIGVKKAKEKIASAKILLYLYNEKEDKKEEVVRFIKTFYRPDLKIILIHNKIDSVSESERESFDKALKTELYPDFCSEFLCMSAKEALGIDVLTNALSDYVDSIKTAEHNTIITNQRHYEALLKSLDAAQKVEEAILQGIHTELLAYELRAALEALGEISGEFTNDELLGHIFSNFCIGK
ncbi:tRNA uridine-5-carboxymethylaminomethyl(34) synthesis GTPase MnmE [Riemerella columbipharyngis]|uniref:tRNA modification GTPase MnmE n=1 Tax=Riemerella columbipharyngis TaxID=1071918 RepID=A0A1G7E7I7_9FLAO|nr:tRNA uridine-5-carboxymethylaminomethyl(34) synthesis GTPase MnmE [Riemerella columbipharyngis]SDE59450.1 tRNA modification GTPase [Riemerella columbipharyngis]